MEDPIQSGNQGLKKQCVFLYDDKSIYFALDLSNISQNLCWVKSFDEKKQEYYEKYFLDFSHYFIKGGMGILTSY